MRVGRHRRRALVEALVVMLLVCAAPRAGRACALLTYTFQPDCFRSDGAAGCAFDATHPDFGPQIAVWVESADGARFVDTLMVTGAVAIHGIGNRPGVWNMRSGPRFPYGRREMALPIWAHARGHLYDTVIMEDAHDDWMTTHEDNSSPEPYFCRPMQAFEIVDAITCPSGRFRSCKGRLDASMPQSYYPPRADLFDFGKPCGMLPNYIGSCDPGDSAQYAFLNDVDVVATATPPFGAPFSSTWVVPDTLPDGDYALYVEVAKEFDADAANQHDSYINPMEAVGFSSYGQEGNIGAPSVLFRVPFSLGAGTGGGAAATEIAGYGDWTGATGDVRAPDGTIGADPGSGAGRLALIDGPTGPGRVHVARAACGPIDCGATAAPTPVAFVAKAASSGRGATLRIHQSNEDGHPVLGYELRTAVMIDDRAPIDPSTFPSWTPAGTVPVGPPDSETDASIDGLAPDTFYAIGLIAHGQCATSPPTFQRITTPSVKFVQLSGCFIATAAFGSDLAPEVGVLRAARDAAVARSGIARAAVDLYYRSSPPVAALIARSDAARALVRTALRAALPSRPAGGL